MEVSAIASMMTLYREGNFSSVFQMFSFLGSKDNDVTVFDPTKPGIYQNKFPNEDWNATHDSPCRKDFPSNDLASRGIRFIMKAIVDSNHTSDFIWS